jgi:abortive infection bacteriophage resistance protein
VGSGERLWRMKYNKLPYDINQQIEKLLYRGLQFDDIKRAKNYLSNVSYYRLSAYTFSFQDYGNESFKAKVSFDQIIDLYNFDRKLRLLIFDAIEKIEISLRTQMIYHFSMRYGSHWQLNPHIYRDLNRFENQLKTLQNEIDRSNESFIEYYKNKYTDPVQPPSWMSLEVSSLGLLSKFFQNLKKGSEKQEVALHFGLHDVSILENWILCFSTLRNICAHHGRVWNRRLIPIKIPTNPKYHFLNNKDIYSNKLYATLSSIEYALNCLSPSSTITSGVFDLINSCPFVNVKEMGFPDNWQDEELWQLKFKTKTD